MPAFPKPSATETDPIASPAVTTLDGQVVHNTGDENVYGAKQFDDTIGAHGGVNLTSTGDDNHRLAYDATKDGPRLKGYAGGILGVGSDTVLEWFPDGHVEVAGDLETAGGSVDTRITAAQSTATSAASTAASAVSSVATITAHKPKAKGIYVPDGWGANYLPKLRAGTLCKVGVIGDSVDAGYNASTKEGSYAGLIKTAMQAIGGDGGSGYVSAERSVTSNSILANYSYKLAQTGTWVEGQQAAKSGPGCASISSVVNGSTVTFPVRGSTVKIIHLQYTGHGTFTYNIDGAGPVSVNCNGSWGIVTQTITGLSAGDHTVVITKTGTTFVDIYGVAGENASGVVLNNFALYNSTWDKWNNDYSLAVASAGRWSGGDQYPQDLMICGGFVNDALAAAAPDTVFQNLRFYLDYVVGNNAANNGACDLLFVLKHIGKWDHATTPKYHLYAERMRGLAEYYGAALVDLGPMWGNNYAQFSAVNGWAKGTDDGSGGSGNNNVHPGNAGHQLYADKLIPIVCGTDSRFVFA